MYLEPISSAIIAVLLSVGATAIWRLWRSERRIDELIRARQQAERARQETLDSRISYKTAMPLAERSVVNGAVRTQAPATHKTPEQLIEKQHYVVLHTMLDWHLQSDVVAPEDMACGNDPVRLADMEEKGAIRKLEAHEARAVKEGQLPGARFVGAVQPQQGLREPLYAQQAKHEELTRTLHARREDEARDKLMREKQNDVILAMAQRYAEK